MAHFIPLQENAKTAADLARIFAKEIWKLHGLPRVIVSDRDSRFTSTTWKELLNVIGIRPRMSTCFHPQTDGQTERTNQVIEAYLRPYLNQEQDDWTDLLLMAEHAYSNSVTSATGMTHFYNNYGEHPESLNPQRMEVMNPASRAYAHWIKGAFENGKKALEAAHDRIAKNTDTRCIAPPAYKIGDPVILCTKHIQITGPLGSWTTNSLAPSKSIKLSLLARYAWYYYKNGKLTLHSMYQISHQSYQGIAQYRTLPKSSEKWATLKQMKNTMWTKSRAASPAETKFYTTSNGSDIERRRIGHPNHTKISRKVVRTNYINFTLTTRTNLRITTYPTKTFNHRSLRGHWPSLFAAVSQRILLQWKWVSNTHM